MHDPAHERTTGPAIGRGVERVEDFRLLTGRACYVGDVKLPGALHAVMLRSPVAHGLIRSIDVSRALEMPGVRAALTAEDLAKGMPDGLPIIPLRQEPLPQLEPFLQPALAHERVRYVGEPIVAIIADSAAEAEDALDAIDIDIEPLPVVADREASARGDILLFEQAGTNCVITVTAARGDADEVLKNAPYMRRERFSIHRHTAVPMETRGLVAVWNDDVTHLTIYGAGKVPFANRRVMAQKFGLPPSGVELVECEIGGAFGVRGEIYPEDFVVPYAAKILKRPVRWVEDRREHLQATNHARDVECDLAIACDEDGRILALRGRARTDAGAYLRTTGVTPSRNIAQVATGPYNIADTSMEVSIMLTNKTPTGTYRGPGRFETDFFRERLLDMAADDLGIDRVEFRRRNLVKESEIPYELPVIQPYNSGTATDSGNYEVTLDRCLKEFDWDGKAKLNGRLIDGRYHGIAIGCYIEGGAAGPSESARLELEADGSISVYIGSSGVGQGLETIVTQIAADALGMPMSKIGQVVHGTTSTVKDGYGSYSSRSTVMGGSAILATAEELKLRIREAAALRFGCLPDEVEIVEGREVRGPGDRVATLAELATTKLSAEGKFSSNSRTYSYGAHAAHVAVHPKTGHVKLIDYVAVEDVGRIINPHTLHGQTLGAIVQGLGGVFLEELHYTDEGQIMNGSLADYLMPSAADFTNIRLFALEMYPSPNNPLGAKGAGEGGIIPVGGLMANAVAAALAPLGAVPRSLPLTPPKIWQLIRDARHRISVDTDVVAAQREGGLESVVPA
jgi:carbon-monoxide dehydrogenase large subunit